MGVHENGKLISPPPSPFFISLAGNLLSMFIVGRALEENLNPQPRAKKYSHPCVPNFNVGEAIG